MLPKEQIDRINALARKAKAEGLTDEEKEEQAALRKAYLDAFRAQFRQMMEQIEFVDEETVATGEEKQFS
ncbi:MAG: DUF896 domain-containing protein [Clostridia bacterium]|nr:DUF896 domain-containing protein [Clostridia bacterium]MBR3196391.1 DUF896 domain-containing protein [Clostridia bacterium]